MFTFYNMQNFKPHNFIVFCINIYFFHMYYFVDVFSARLHQKVNITAYPKDFHVPTAV